MQLGTGTSATVSACLFHTLKEAPAFWCTAATQQPTSSTRVRPVSSFCSSALTAYVR